MAFPKSRREAKELLDQIVKDHGYISQEKLQQIEDAQLRREIKEALLAKDQLIGANNLYTSKARFVFELLQNADDNHYSKAAAMGSEPYVSFHIYPRRIVFECNEDGFTSADLQAICSVGKSSKTGAQGYIGEKGFGFKSVFIAAWKVHIQSGAFSFSFRHRSGDSGLGMISPIWEEEEDDDDEVERPLTRITLHLDDRGDTEVLAKTRESIREQFEKLQETFLLFLKNLRRVHPQTGRAVLRRAKVPNNTATTEVQAKHFYITTHQATNLAKNENRTYSTAEEDARVYSTSNIVIAFPLSETSVPVVAPQELFAYLPVRPVGFSFLVQADFVTGASREDVVEHSLRNIGLVHAVADAFAKAVVQLSAHGSLRYTWMRYLPGRNAARLGPLWQSLVNKIDDRLYRLPVLHDRRHPHRRVIRELVRLPGDKVIVDDAGELLFDDRGREQLISPGYEERDLGFLEDYGLRVATFDHVIGWLREDLGRGAQSRMRSPHTPESWHRSAATLLCHAFREGLEESIAVLKSMDLLPLEDGTWTSLSSGPVYFSTVGQKPIPSDLGLRLIAKSVRSHSRMVLFSNLGVTSAPISLVRRKILERYPDENSDLTQEFSIPLETSRHHLEFLYLTHQLRRPKEPCYKRLAIHDLSRSLHRPAKRFMYIVNSEPYGPWELLKKTDSAPGFENAVFVNEEYFRNSPATRSKQELSWLEWLYAEVGVDRYINFGCQGKLTAWAIYLQKHKPEKFLGGLLVSYQHFGPPAQTVVDALQKTEVLCRDGRLIHLKETYFPNRNLEERVERYVEPGAHFPWLWLDTENAGPHHCTPSAWKKMLAHLCAGAPATDLGFALDMLKHSRAGFSSTDAPGSRARLFDLYGHIEAIYQGMKDTKDTKEKRTARNEIRRIFSETALLYVPPSGNESHTWTFLYMCVWDAPRNLETKLALRSLYKPCFAADDVDISLLQPFFTTTLGISRCTWNIYFEELKALKARGCDDWDTINAIYRALDDLRPQIIGVSRYHIKAAFEEDALIYLPLPDDEGPAWKKVSQCVWSGGAATLQGRVSINHRYEGLEGLFVDLLDVKPLDLPMAIDELKEAGSRASVSEVKNSIWTVNLLLLDAESGQHPDPGDVLESRVFPVRMPRGSVSVECVSTATEFFVVDRETIRERFEGRVKFLDFSLEEVSRLRPFLEWTRLGARHLSRCVRETTSFHSGSVTDADRQIWDRAHAILRIANHFGSPRTQSRLGRESFYKELRNVKILATDGVIADLWLSQDGPAHVVKGRRTALHVDEDDDHSCLKIYVPHDKDDQEYTFAKLLAPRLFKHIMTTRPNTEISGASHSIANGVDALRDVLLSPRRRIATALEDNGIAAVDISDIDPGEDGPLLTDTETLAASRRTGDGKTALPDFTPAPSAAHTSFSPANRMGYADLLEKVVASARGSDLPRHGAFAIDRLWASLLGAKPAPLHLQCASQRGRDNKVGAAGELYAFELLSSLQLPGFSRDNWQSNIRDNVTMHRDYADLKAWVGSETSDIVYNNDSGALTRLLVDKGYPLDGDVWTARKPRYFIEVKATAASCETPFSMTREQYQRMRDNKMTAQNGNAIYVIFRVYHLGRDDMGVRVYLDPESLRVSGKLDFTVDKWKVTPTDC